MSDFTPSTYQQQFFDWCQDGQGNVVLNAVAGSGKTTTLLHAAHTFTSREQSVIFVAFSNEIVKTAQDRLANSGDRHKIEVSTIHRIGRACLARYLGPKLRLEEDKYKTLSQNWIHENCGKGNPSHRIWARSLTKLVNLTRQTLTDPTEFSALQALTVRFDVDLPQSLFPAVQAILIEGERIGKDRYIDYTDMLYLPLRWGLTPVQFDCVIADEIQDFNIAQMELIAQLVTPHGRFIGAGDPHQAIMAFTGADDQAYFRVRNRFDATEFHLPLCYRCPTTHIMIAKQIVPEIEAHPDAGIGSLLYAKEHEFLDLVKRGDLILHRKTAPLIEKCLQLIEHGHYARVRGNEIGEDLIQLAEKLSMKPGFSMQQFEAYLDNYEATQTAALLKLEDADVFLDRLSDQCAGLRACYRRFQSKTLDQLQESIQGLFSNHVATVYLSTIHGAKGLEVNRVLLLDYDSLPMQWEGQRPWQYTQEENLLYVALTRSKCDLVIFGEPRDALRPIQDLNADTFTTDPVYKQLLSDPSLDFETRKTLAGLPQQNIPQKSLGVLVRCIAMLSAQNQQLTTEIASFHTGHSPN